jgi:hypothetical protein
MTDTPATPPSGRALLLAVLAAGLVGVAAVGFLAFRLHERAAEDQAGEQASAQLDARAEELARRHDARLDWEDQLLDRISLDALSIDVEEALAPFVGDRLAIVGPVIDVRRAGDGFRMEVRGREEDLPLYFLLDCTSNQVAVVRAHRHAAEDTFIVIAQFDALSQAPPSPDEWSSRFLLVGRCLDVVAGEERE